MMLKAALDTNWTAAKLGGDNDPFTQFCPVRVATQPAQLEESFVKVIRHCKYEFVSPDLTELNI